MSDEVNRIIAILATNKDKDFVRRILDPDNSPSLDLGKGYKGTHMMATAEADGKFYAYATIQKMSDGSLKRLDPTEAFHQALADKEVIEFDSQEEANWFATNYKKVWTQ